MNNEQREALFDGLILLLVKSHYHVYSKYNVIAVSCHSEASWCEIIVLDETMFAQFILSDGMTKNIKDFLQVSNSDPKSLDKLLEFVSKRLNNN